jgi:lipid-binding SYLF domain-containing protein
LRSDGGANEKLYGQKLSATDIIRGGKVKAPAAAQGLIATLTAKTPRHKTQGKASAMKKK